MRRNFARTGLRLWAVTLASAFVIGSVGVVISGPASATAASISGKVSYATGGPVGGACVQIYTGTNKHKITQVSATATGTYNAITPTGAKFYFVEAFTGTAQGGPLTPPVINCATNSTKFTLAQFPVGDTGEGVQSFNNAEKIKGGSTHVGFLLHKTSAHTISGRVVNAVGTVKLTKVCVEAHDQTGNHATFLTASNATGAYVLPEVADGKYTVHFFTSGCTTFGSANPGFVTQYWSLKNATAFTPPSGTAVDVTSATKATINAKLNAAGGLNGKVKNQAGAVVAGACVSVTQVTSGSGSIAAEATQTTTTSTGNYTVTGLNPADTYIVKFSTLGCGVTQNYLLAYFDGTTNGTTVLSAAKRESITAGASVTANINLLPGGEIKGKITLATATLTVAPTICATATANGATFRTQDTSNGSYLIQGLPSGSYTVKFEECKHTVTSHTAATQWWQGKITRLNARSIAVTAGATPVGTISPTLNPGGQLGGSIQVGSTPEAGVCIKLFQAGQLIGTAVTTNTPTAGTTWYINALPGKYTVVLSAGCGANNVVTTMYPTITLTANTLTAFNQNVAAGTPPVFTSASPPTVATDGTPYSYTFQASGATPMKYVFSSTPTPPTWLSITSASGKVSGTPKAGTVTFSYGVTATNHVGTPVSTATFTITSLGGVPGTPILQSGTPQAKVGTHLDLTFHATGTPAPTLTETGTLPKGCHFVGGASGTGVITCVAPATGVGAHTFTITAHNSTGPPKSATFTIGVDTVATMSVATTVTFKVGTPVSLPINLSGFPMPKVTETGALPNGVTFNTLTASFSGAPLPGSGGPYIVTLTAANGVGANVKVTIAIVVVRAPVIQNAATTTFYVGHPGVFQLVIGGFPLPTVSISTSVLPAGLRFTATAENFTGTPAVGDSPITTVTILAQNTLGRTTQILRIVISSKPPPTLTSSSGGRRSGGPLGYRLVASDGGIFSYGNAVFYGSTGAKKLNEPIVAMTATPDAKGYWLVASDGGIFSYGDAVFYGSTGAKKLNEPIVAMASSPDGKGYWLVASDGGIFSYGDAVFYGSTGAKKLNEPIVALASTPDGKGYWLVASDGGIFSYGDAVFSGSTGAKKLNKAIVTMAATPDGKGYWLLASDGGIFSYGDAVFYGSTGAKKLNQPIVDMAPTPDGKGYWLVASDGGIFSYGDAVFFGSTGAKKLNEPIVGMAG